MFNWVSRRARSALLDHRGERRGRAWPSASRRSSSARASAAWAPPSSSSGRASTTSSILEREDDLGGTWHVNRYPGLAVDIASVTYSYSFEPNPWWWHWYARGPELKKYAEHVADKYDLRRHMRFDTVVEGATLGRATPRSGRSGIAGGEPLRAAYLVTATGFLSQPRHARHRRASTTSRAPSCTPRSGTTPPTWTASGSAIIGTGATAVQLIPELAERAEHLTVFQRTPIWVTPKLDREIPGWCSGCSPTVPLDPAAARARVNTAAARADHGGRRAPLPAGASCSTAGLSGSPSGTCASRSPTPSCAAS